MVRQVRHFYSRTTQVNKEYDPSARSLSLFGAKWGRLKRAPVFFLGEGGMAWLLRADVSTTAVVPFSLDFGIVQ